MRVKTTVSCSHTTARRCKSISQSVNQSVKAMFVCTYVVVYLYTLYTRAYVTLRCACTCLFETPNTYGFKHIYNGRMTDLT